MISKMLVEGQEMAEIRDFFISIFNARQDAASKAASRSIPGAAATKPETVPDAPQTQRTIRDTVTLSNGGQKIVNLARGNELANEFRNAPVDADYGKRLTKAFEDISRVARLFTETFKSAFSSRSK